MEKAKSWASLVLYITVCFIWRIPFFYVNPKLRSESKSLVFTGVGLIMECLCMVLKFLGVCVLDPSRTKSYRLKLTVVSTLLYI